jgi:molybdopterin/thiamine biosynthesis adenylyltransferase
MNTLAHEEKYRGQILLKRMAELPVIICGVGAVGSNLVENMARQGFKKFSVIDMDRVEDHNRHTQVYDRRDVGLLKVAAMKGRIFNVMGFSIETESKKLDASTIKKMLKSGSLVIDGFDNVESRRIVTDHCRKENILCLHVGLFQDYAEVIWNQSYRVPDKVQGLDVCEYPLARNIAMMAGIVATEVIIRYLRTGSFDSYIITLGDLTIRQL